MFGRTSSSTYRCVNPAISCSLCVSDTWCLLTLAHPMISALCIVLRVQIGFIWKEEENLSQEAHWWSLILREGVLGFLFTVYKWLYLRQLRSPFPSMLPSWCSFVSFWILFGFSQVNSVFMFRQVGLNFISEDAPCDDWWTMNMISIVWLGLCLIHFPPSFLSKFLKNTQLLGCVTVSAHRISATWLFWISNSQQMLNFSLMTCLGIINHLAIWEGGLKVSHFFVNSLYVCACVPSVYCTLVLILAMVVKLRIGIVDQNRSNNCKILH